MDFTLHLFAVFCKVCFGFILINDLLILLGIAFAANFPAIGAFAGKL